MELAEVLRKPVVSLDLETTGFDWSKDKITRGNLGWKSGDQVIGVSITDLNLLKHIVSSLFRSPVLVVGWGLKFDLHFLRTTLGLTGPYTCRFWDGMIASHLLDENIINNDHELKGNCERLFGLATGYWEDEKNWARKEGWLRFDSKLWEYYGATDAILSYMYWEAIHRQIAYEFAGLWQTEMALMLLLLEMEERGVLIDVDYLARLPLPPPQGAGLHDQLDLAIKRLHEYAPGLNPNSPKQVSAFLYGKLKLKPLKFTKKGNPKTDEESLRTYAHIPQVQAIVSIRELEKLLTNYVDGILIKVDSKGYLHGKFNQIGTVSGRLSSSDPNLQNIPRGPLIRRAFQADPWLFDNDCVQIEARLFAHFAAEPSFIQAFEEGLDIHAHTYADIHHIPIDQVTEPQRKKAKAQTFGIMYGSGSEKQARVLGVSKREAKALLERYYARYPAIRMLQTRTRAIIEDRGYIRNPYGRKARLPSSLAYVGVNRLIQGTSADIFKRGAVALWKEFPQFPQRLHVHDEIVWDLPEGYDPTVWVPRVKECLEACVLGFRPRIEWDTEHSQKSWGEKTPYDPRT